MRAPTVACVLLLLLAVCCTLVAAHALIPPPHHHHPHRPSRPQNSLCAQQSVTPVSCASADVLLPHPDDCRLFYHCVRPYLRPVCRQCPANLHFNPVSLVCDWSAQAGCSLASTTTTVSTSEDDTATYTEDTTATDSAITM